MASAVRVIIHGRVQGVSYRAWTVETASALQLKGWVRNRSDGTVEAAFHGEADIIEAMIEACKTGPSAARVDGIERFDSEDIKEASFVTKPTL